VVDAVVSPIFGANCTRAINSSIGGSADHDIFVRAAIFSIPYAFSVLYAITPAFSFVASNTFCGECVVVSDVDDMVDAVFCPTLGAISFSIGRSTVVVDVFVEEAIFSVPCAITRFFPYAIARSFRQKEHRFRQNSLTRRFFLSVLVHLPRDIFAHEFAGVLIPSQ